MSSQTPSSQLESSPLVDFTDHIDRDSAIQIAGGAFGDVYKCKCRDSSGSSSLVAVKSPRYYPSEDPEENQRKLDELNNKVLRREFGLLRRFEHPNIVPLLGVANVFGPALAAVLPWMSNGALHSFLEHKGQTLTVVERLQLVHGIGSGLEYLHSNDVFHGDLHSGNVLIDEEHKPRISDFGLACIMGRLQPGLTYLERLSSMSKPVAARWAAPERLSGSQPNPSADIYSFGCLIFEVLSGDVPWKEETDYQVVASKLKAHKPPSRPIHPGVEDVHWALMVRCWLPSHQRPTARHIVEVVPTFFTADNHDIIQHGMPKHLTFPGPGVPGVSVVTCLLLSHGRIISATDDPSIHVYSPVTGELLQSLDGHDGGVWALAATEDTLVSGSTDRTVRVWDLATGRCTHVFSGHTSTVRCLAIVKPELVEDEGEGGVISREEWPKRSVIVSGSRDSSLRVWTLPCPGDPEYRSVAADDADDNLLEEDINENPYHKLHLGGHDHSVRALAARGRTLVSGSYDCTVRIWDIVTGECKRILSGHAHKVYSVVLDLNRNIVCSGSMDGTIRIWNLHNGQCRHILTGHTSMVGLLGLSPSYLVSAAADCTLCVWDPNTGELRHTFAAHAGAITCFQHDEFKVLSGSSETLKMWDIRDGTVVRDLLTGTNGVWQVAFEGRRCVALSNRNTKTMFDVWDFGKGNDDWIGEPGI